MKRFVWFSDTHLNLSPFPFLKHMFMARLSSAKPDGLFLTGDISSGFSLEYDLRFLARHFDGHIYFVLGNHDYHKRYIDSVHSDIKRICKEHDNLHWMTDEGVISLSKDVALVGTEGWYDAKIGNFDLLKLTFDWFLTLDFLRLKDFQTRLDYWRKMAQDSAQRIADQIDAALQEHKTVYVLTHFPPWKEAARAIGTRMEEYWLPYNTNIAMGEAIENVALKHPKKRIVILSGHTHTPCSIRVAENIECNVARASYLGRVKLEKIIMI